MNFNYNASPEYDLYSQGTEEVINLYGVAVKFLVTEKINKDDLVFGDYSHLKTDSSKIFDIYGMPETTETWDNLGMNFSEYGMFNLETINLFVHKNSLSFLDFSKKGFDSIIGNLIVLPSNRILEITDFQFEIPGINNLFTYKNDKNCFKLNLRTYQNKIINEVQSEDLTAPLSEQIDYTTLDNYFDELIGEKNTQDIKTTIENSVTVIEKAPNEPADRRVQRPLIDNSEDSVFGKF